MILLYSDTIDKVSSFREVTLFLLDFTNLDGLACTCSSLNDDVRDILDPLRVGSAVKLFVSKPSFLVVLQSDARLLEFDGGSNR